MVTVFVLGAAAELLEGSEKLVAVASLAADLGTSGDPPRDGLHELSLGGDVIAETACRHTSVKHPKRNKLLLRWQGNDVLQVSWRCRDSAKQPSWSVDLPKAPHSFLHP